MLNTGIASSKKESASAIVAAAEKRGAERQGAETFRRIAAGEKENGLKDKNEKRRAAAEEI